MVGQLRNLRNTEPVSTSFRAMKKTAQYPSILSALGILLAVFFVALPVHAQSGHFILFQQGQIGSQTAYDTSNHIYTVRIGTGNQGTTTGAFVAVSGDNATPGSSPTVALTGYTDAAYSAGAITCTWRGDNRPAAQYSATSTNPFYQLDYLVDYSGSGHATDGECWLDPTRYYTIQISYNFTNAGHFRPGSIAGRQGWVLPLGWSATTTTDSDTSFFPYFTIVSDHFQVVPTLTNSGLFLSGAQSFCNNQFGSTTSVGSYVGQGICVAVAYLFVPTPESLDFSGIKNDVFLKFPFSWFATIQSVLGSATASTTNFAEVRFNLHDAVASTTDPTQKVMAIVLPNITVFSPTTVTQYLGTSTLATIKNLIRWSLWGALATDVYFIVIHII